ncbi:MAG: sialate O-acetylesterase [Verrucomicrobia bacterium]|nr:sialate O-acetylesterase [Verrucomicrobiota bacterium]
MKTPFFLSILILLTSKLVFAEVQMPNIFGNHMVLQRDQLNPVWGTATPGERISVRIGGQSHSTYAGPDGRWKVKLRAMSAGGPHALEVKADNELRFEDVMVGEVWICSGQSNMQWSLNKSDGGDLEIPLANEPMIRMISIPQLGTQVPQDNFNGKWEHSSPAIAAEFSAVGYHFGQRLKQALGVTIGLIDNAWGGSAAEAWVPRDILEADGHCDAYLAEWDKKVAAYTDEVHAEKVARLEAWKANGRKGRAPWPNDIRVGQHRPANLYNGALHPIIGYGIRGVIWYQGETNSGRAANYNHLFPLMINTWRDHWKQGDFPFYWVQLADFSKELPDPQQNSWWAELREAQTNTLSLPNTGQAVIIDVGEGRDIHPRNKRTVGDRLARHALAKDYGFNIASESPRYSKMEISGGEVNVTFDHVSAGGLYAFDVPEVKGFDIAGADGVFRQATASIEGKTQVVVSHPQIANPAAVRYGWAENPVLNLFDRNGLPVTPFRTDDGTLGQETPAAE